MHKKKKKGLLNPDHKIRRSSEVLIDSQRQEDYFEAERERERGREREGHRERGTQREREGER